MISLKKYWIEKSKIVSWDQYPIEAFKKKSLVGNVTRMEKLIFSKTA